MIYQTLCNEPWCWSPGEVSELTDWQVWELILNPTIRRNREFDPKYQKRKARRQRQRDEEDKELDLTKEEYLNIGVQLGGEREQLSRMYDQQMAKLKDPNSGQRPC